ncbi:branched-chain amino acid ABC transporter permease [Bradyrhizobium sp.]|uniref:branched-chain amino acid ABC transporter permease n=1 Tax=Bradyrhizobium sp. TaxID=376 RepID=UPI003C250E88
MAVLGLVPAIVIPLGVPFYVALCTRIMIFAIAAISLDLIVGYGGMNSMGHAAFLGIGAYSVGIFSAYGIDNGFIQFGIAMLASALIAAFIGIISLRTSGIHFIMITLAFGQMLYFLMVSINSFGGDDGLTIAKSSIFFLLDLRSPVTLYYCCFAVLVLVLWIMNRLIGSRFGMALRGLKSNQARMVAIGLSPFRYKLAAFVLSGTICGIAGALLANEDLFISPASMHWARSAEILMIVIVGGAGSLLGAVLGAAAYVSLEYFLSGFTEHWQIILGLILLLVILFRQQGLYGLLLVRTRSTRNA